MNLPSDMCLARQSSAAMRSWPRRWRESGFSAASPWRARRCGVWRVWRGHRCGDIKADRLSLVFARLQVSKRGALTGGYHDPSASHIDIIKAIRTTQKEVRRWGSGHVNWVWIPRFLPVFPIYAKLDEAQTALSDKEAVLANIDAKVASLTAEISKDEMARTVIFRDRPIYLFFVTLSRYA